MTPVIKLDKHTPPEDAPDFWKKILSRATDALNNIALDTSRILIGDATMRAKYNERIKAMSRRILDAVDAGEMEAEYAAASANELRNKIMEQTRARTSRVGNAYANAEKGDGKKLAKCIDDASAELFKKIMYVRLISLHWILSKSTKYIEK